MQCTRTHQHTSTRGHEHSGTRTHIRNHIHSVSSSDHAISIESRCSFSAHALHARLLMLKSITGKQRLYDRTQNSRTEKQNDTFGIWQNKCEKFSAKISRYLTKLRETSILTSSGKRRQPEIQLYFGRVRLTYKVLQDCIELTIICVALIHSTDWNLCAGVLVYLEICSRNPNITRFPFPSGFHVQNALRLALTLSLSLPLDRVTLLRSAIAFISFRLTEHRQVYWMSSLLLFMFGICFRRLVFIHITVGWQVHWRMFLT